MTQTRTALPVFPNSTQIPRRVPLGVWDLVRVVGVLCLVGIIVVLFVDSDTGLDVLWGVAVPVLPAVWFLAPGFWRNACPLATANQAARRGGFTRAAERPAWLARYSYVIGFAAFFAFAVSRKILLNRSGLASGLALGFVLILAFVGGWLFKGKSGWCSSICPLLPVQRLYGQAPFVVEPNAHCQPCVGCTRNCYDFNPGAAQFADLHDPSDEYAGHRRLFAGLFPGFVIGFFVVPDAAEIGSWEVLGRMGLAVLLSLGAYQVLASLLPVSRVVLTAAFGAAALNFFYGYGLPRVGSALDRLFGFGLPETLTIGIRLALGAATVAWLYRIWRSEGRFLEQASSQPVARISSTAVLTRKADDLEAIITVDGKDLVSSAGETLLDVIEAADLGIEPGCRLGVCGADPVAVRSGMDCLSAIDGDEQSTLERLGFAGNTRMACKARIEGDVEVSLVPDRGEVAGSNGEGADPEIRRVVVVGTGIAGVTAADFARRTHPECEIHIVGREVHGLYNRMGISRLIYGRTAMHGLHLQDEGWFDEHRIIPWLNTRAVGIDRVDRAVALATGDRLEYDRLILATGAASFVPPIGSWGAPGTFVLRDVADATGIRSFAQEHQIGTALVAGGGLLGLEAAYALLQLGLQVTVLERGPSLLRRQLDDAAGMMLQRYLERLGLGIMSEVSVTDVVADDGRMSGVRLTNGAALAGEILVVAAGVSPNVELAEGAGLDVERGIVVDDGLRTSDPDIFAVGDAAAHRGRVYGLWPAAVDQGRVAGINAVGVEDAHVRYPGTTPVTMLKVVGVDLLSMGRVRPDEGDIEILRPVDEDGDTYAKLVVDRDGHLVGAILLWEPELGPSVTTAVKERRDVSGVLAALTAGDWSVLEAVGSPA